MKLNKLNKKAIAFLLVILLALGTAPAALADEVQSDSTTTGIVYKGQDNWLYQNIFKDKETGTQYTATDLFSNPEFKNVMPGDKMEQVFIVKNESSNSIKLFMEVIPHGEQNALSESVAQYTTTEQMIDFLSYFSMQVTAGEGDNKKVLFEIPFDKDERSNLGVFQSEKEELGILYAEQGAELKVVMNVSRDMGNEFASTLEALQNGEFKGIGEVDFRFTIEEQESGGGGGITPKPDPDIPIDDPDVPKTEPDEPVIIPGEPVEDIPDPEIPLGDAPKTGDNTKILPLILLMLAALAGLVITRKKCN